MTNQNITSPALYHQNQPPDSGSVHESQRQKLWLSRHRSHRYTCGVCFCLECSTIFSGEGRHLVLGLPRASKSSFLLMTNQNINTPSPLSPEPTSWLWLCTWVTSAEALAIAASQAPPYMPCVFLFKGVLHFSWRQEAKPLLLVLRPPKVRFCWWQIKT